MTTLREAADDFAPIRARDVFRPRADDDRQLAFVVDALRLLRTDDRPFVRQQRRRRLEKDDRVGRELVAQLLGVIGVVASDGDDLRRRLRAEKILNLHFAMGIGVAGAVAAARTKSKASITPPNVILYSGESVNTFEPLVFEPGENNDDRLTAVLSNNSPQPWRLCVLGTPKAYEKCA